MDEPNDLFVGDANFDPQAYEEFSYIDRDNKAMVERIR